MLDGYDSSSHKDQFGPQRSAVGIFNQYIKSGYQILMVGLLTKKAVMTRLLVSSMKSVLSLARRLPLVDSVDLAEVITNHTERILSLPEKWSFFVTRATPVEQVESLLRRLHPV